MSSPRILLLEDDSNLNDTICDYLEELGYEVIPFYDGAEAEDKIFEEPFDLLLLDVNTPSIDGFTLLKNSRERGTKTPAIYITARDSVDDLEKGFKSGCNDYIRKPFALKELKIRMETLLNRGLKNRVDIYTINQNIKFDPQSGEIDISGKKIQLGQKESKLLLLFLKNPGTVLSHEKIFDELWGYDETPSDSSLRTYIKNLRKLLGKERIVSIKRRGYKYLATE